VYDLSGGVATLLMTGINHRQDRSLHVNAGWGELPRFATAGQNESFQVVNAAYCQSLQMFYHRSELSFSIEGSISNTIVNLHFKTFQNILKRYL